MPNDLEEPDNDQPDESSVMRELRKQADAGKAAEARAAELERELAVHKAGLTGLTERQLKVLTREHDGEWDTESLKATAAELGFGKSQPDSEQSTDPQIPAEELAAHQRVAAASGGEPPAPPVDLTARIAEAKNSEEVKTLLRNAGRLAEGD